MALGAFGAHGLKAVLADHQTATIWEKAVFYHFIHAVMMFLVAYIVLVERKVLADFQVRLGPMRVGPHGLLQPIADALKLLLKEDIIPSGSDKAIFWFAPCISTFTGLTAFAVIPFSKMMLTCSSPSGPT